MSDDHTECACANCHLLHSIKLLRTLVRNLVKRLDELDPEAALTSGTEATDLDADAQSTPGPDA